MLIRKLALSNFAVRRTRVALTVSAVALSVSLVVSVTSGYASLFEAAFRYLNQYMGTTDARISRLNDPIGVPESLVDELRRDPAVRRADGRLEISSFIPNTVPDPDEQPPSPTKHVRLVGIDRPMDRRVERQPMEAGTWFDSSTGEVCLIDQAVAGILGVGVGDSVTLPYANQSLKLKVVGIVHKPAVLTAHMRTIYLPLHTLQNFVGAQGKLSNILIDFSGALDPKTFAANWRQKLSGMNPPVQIHLTSDIRSQMDQNLQGMKLLSYLGSSVSMLAATFIIFSALSMGVAERQRSLAMLRAVGALRTQIGLLVVFEGFLLAMVGLLIGVPLGWIWIKALSLLFPKIFTAGVVVSGGGLLLGAGGTVVTALAASLLPAWNATRVDPLAAMSPLAQSSTAALPIGWAIAGLFLASIDPFLFFGPLQRIIAMMGVADPDGVARTVTFYGHLFVGLPGIFLGFFLLAPLFVWVVERVAGPLVALPMNVRYPLLRQQLSNGVWRAAGTASALMVGLAVLVSMQVNGHTMLGGWKLPDKFPDVFIATSGLTEEQEQVLAQTPGLRTLMPITVATTSMGGMGGSPFAIAGSMLIPSSTMFVGIDPAKAFDMMSLDFRMGSADEAKRRLSEGDWVIVTQEYRQLKKNLQLGDSITLGGHAFKIAAVVWSPGLDVMAGMYDMGDQFEQRTVSSVFGSIADSRKYFGGRPYVFAADLQPGVERVELIKRVKKEITGQGFQVGDVREIKAKIETGFYHLLGMMSTVAFAALAVASLGVTNTVMAGVRSRRWQFGVLRAVGVTRGQLLRLVLAEAVLLGLIGAAQGLAAGMLMSIDANAFAITVAGYQPPLVIPWNYIIIGLLSVLLIAVLASLWPAIVVADSEPLALLQAGRASA